MGRDICAKALFLVSLLICQESIVVASNIQNGKNSIPRMESGLRSTTQVQSEKSVLLETQQQTKTPLPFIIALGFFFLASEPEQKYTKAQKRNLLNRRWMPRQKTIRKQNLRPKSSLRYETSPRIQVYQAGFTEASYQGATG